MAKRKQTPDVLAEILGGEAAIAGAAVAGAAVAEKNAPARTSRPARIQPEIVKWEYRIVSFQDYKGWRPRYVDGRELKDWTSGPLIQEYLEEMGEQGWELAAASAGERMFGSGDHHQLYFKRPA